MRFLVWSVVSVVATMCLSSCFLVSIPVKATGEMIEKSAEATGDAMNRGIHKVTRPKESGTADDETWDDGAGSYDDVTPLLPSR